MHKQYKKLLSCQILDYFVMFSRHLYVHLTIWPYIKGLYIDRNYQILGITKDRSRILSSQERVPIQLGAGSLQICVQETLDWVSGVRAVARFVQLSIKCLWKINGKHTRKHQMTLPWEFPNAFLKLSYTPLHYDSLRCFYSTHA